MDKGFIIIPAHNEEKVIGNVISDIKKVTDIPIVVVNDGSLDKTSDHAFSAGATILSHSINRGAGAATKTGIEYAKQENADFVITMDADGQHSPSDLPTIIENINSGNYDVVIGSRMIDRKNMPLYRRFFNTIGNLFTFFLFGIYVKDTQSGFKAFNKKALKLIDFQSDGYEFCSEVIREIKLKKLKYIEVPIKTIYTKYSLSKGQNVSKGLAIIFKLFFGK